MSFSILETVDDGISRLTTAQLLPLLAVAIGIQLVSVIGTQSQLAAQREQFADDPLLADLVPETLPLALEIPLGVALLLWLVAALVAVTVSLVAIRAFVAVTQTGESWLQLDSLLRGTVSALAVLIILGIVVPLGLVAFVLPGLFLITVFLVTLPAIAIERKSALDSLRRSYELTTGHRLRVFGVFLVTLLGFFGISFFGNIGFLLFGPGSLLAEVLSVAFSTIAWLFVLAALTSTFDQLEALAATQAEKWDGTDEELLP